MNKPLKTILRQSAWRPALVTALIAATTAVPAYAQIEKVNTVLMTVQNILVGVSVTFFTITFLWAGFKMAAQHAKWSEVAHIFYGGILAGGAAGFAAMLVG